MRGNDVYDIAEIIKNYFHFNSEAIWEHHSDLFTDDNELDEIAAQYLGREIGKIISGNQRLIERIKGIIQKSLNEDDSNALVEILASESDETLDFSKSIISHILAGLNEINL